MRRGGSDEAREAVEAGRQVEFHAVMVVDYEAFAARLLTEIEASPSAPDA